MPELPEVTTIVSDLQILVKRNCYIDVVDVNGSGSLIKVDKQEFIDSLTGQHFKSIERVGKWIRILLANDKCLVIHLGLFGGLVLNINNVKLDYPRIKFHVIGDSVDHDLIYNDMRCFGKFYLFNSVAEAKDFLQDRVGPDPLMIDHRVLKAILHRSSDLIADTLLNQEMISGIGNIYRSEILHVAQIRPDRPCTDLTDDEMGTLSSAMKSVLTTAIYNRGTSIQDYVDGFGDDGGNQDSLWVYGREGHRCRRQGCHGRIVKSDNFDRSVYYCPECQK